jgi:hypothetical protein
MSPTIYRPVRRCVASLLENSSAPMSDKGCGDQSPPPQPHDIQIDLSAFHRSDPSPLAVKPQSKGGPRQSTRENRKNPWVEIQSLRDKLAEHEEIIVKLKAAFGMIALGLDAPRPVQTTSPSLAAFVSSFSGSNSAAAGCSSFEAPANRPPRLLRRGEFINNNNNNINNNNANRRSYNKGRRQHYDREDTRYHSSHTGNAPVY